MALFPFFVNIEGAVGLIIGGDIHIKDKIEKLRPYGPRLHLIAPKICPKLKEVVDEYGRETDGETVFLTWSERSFEEEDLTPAPDFVVVSTGDRQEDHRIAQLCRQQRILVNVVDDQPACSFVFPSLIARGSLSVGICTGGASPSAGMYLKKQMEEILPENTEEILDWLQSKRPQIAGALPHAKTRHEFYRGLSELCMSEGRIPGEEELEAMLKTAVKGY